MALDVKVATPNMLRAIADFVEKKQPTAAGVEAHLLTQTFLNLDYREGVFLSEFIEYVLDNVEGVERLKNEPEGAKFFQTFSAWIRISAQEFTKDEDGFFRNQLKTMIQIRFDATALQRKLMVSRGLLSSHRLEGLG